VTRGELLFQQTAGDVGCQYCHGTDAKGLVGPDIREADASKIQFALGKVEAMAFIYLTEEEIQDVAAYLQSLES
jgi:mono/diheme cytochrome c family protein